MSKNNISVSVENKLKALYDLQCLDSAIDQLRIVRGELPVEIQDLEDEISQLESRINNFENESLALKNHIKEKKSSISDSNALIEDILIRLIILKIIESLHL